MPLYRRLPKRGFKPILKETVAILNLDKIQNLIENKKIKQDTQINLDNAVPVHIQYRTVFKGQNGKINYRSDIYGRDAMVFINMVDAGLIIDI